jgi:hypothetical protein
MTYVLHKDPHTERLTPDPDGATVEFSTSIPYLSGTVQVWHNGLQLDPRLDDGFLESGGTLITMKMAPKTLDILVARYDPA